MRHATRLPLLLSLVAAAAFAAAPTVTTTSATSVTSTSAALNGSINPGGESTTGWFRLSTTSPGTCNDSFGTRVPGTGGTGVGSGTAATPYNLSATGLLPGNTYYFCAIAQNASGQVFGALLTFSTPALIPTASTTSATLVTSSTATLNGEANPNGSSTQGYFRYSSSNPGACTTSFGARAPASGGAALGSGNALVPYTELITGLQAGATYWYCAIGTNGVGTGLGNLLSFTALVTAPSVTTSAASSVTGTSATLNGSANPNGSSATGWFRVASSNPGSCNDAFGTRVPASGGSALGGGTTAQAFAQSATGLSPGTTYYFCAIASNGEGTTLGAVQTFTTPATPTVTTDLETNLLATSATLNGTATANGSTATAWFRYANVNPGTCSDAFGTRLPAVSGGTTVTVGPTAYAQNVTGLLPGTTYYFCAIASNGVGTSVGTLRSFTTPASVPIISTGGASSVTATTATLEAAGIARGAATTAWFRYASTSPGTCNDSFGTRAPSTGGANLGSGNTSTPYSEPVTGLSPGTTYYFCALAQNSVGLSVGSLLTFTTPDVPVVTTGAAASVTGTTATLNGTADANLALTTAWFRYATTSPGTCNDSFGTRAPASGGSNMGSGTTAQAYAQPVTGLAPGTTYYFCAIASNVVGTGFGAVQSFTTPNVPTLLTTAASLVTGTTATLNATVTANGSTTSIWFRFAATDPGSCSDSFGTRAPASSVSDTVIAAGASNTNVARAITALLPGTQYWVCALATNAVGTTLGNVLTFTTPPLTPTVFTSGATLVTGTTATLNGSANPRGDSAVGSFRYATVSPGTCNDTFGVRVPASGGTALGSGNTSQAFSEGLTGLVPGTTYFYCAIATNGVGTGFGSVLSFVTPNVPQVVTSAVSSLTGVSVTLNGTGDPNDATTTGYFRYATTSPGTCNDSFGTRAPASGGSGLGAGSSPVSFAQALSGLTPGQTYFYCALASNLVGTGVGAVLSFTTPAAPTLTTEPATAVLASSATLNAVATSNGSTTNVYFRYSTSNPVACNDSFGTRMPSSSLSDTVLAGTAVATPVARAITGLLPGWTYYFCALATNLVGTTFGAVRSFTTPPLAPTVSTSTVTGLTSTGATLRGSANPNGAATTGWFRYSATNPGTCNDSFGFRLPFMGGAALGSGNSFVAYSEPLTGLSLVTTYYYCAIAQNSEGTSFGAVQSFTTLAELPAVTTLAATALTTTSATLNASATPNGSSATGWFRYSTTNPGSCNDTFGTRAPASGGTALGSGTSAVGYSVTPMSLTVGATYYYCAIVQNGVGTGYGAVLTFQTTPTAPTLNTLAATGLSGTTAQLNGSVTPNGAATTGWFRFSSTNPGTCNDTFGTRAPGSGGTSVGAGTTAQPYSEVLTGLVPGTTYYFCALASNALGTVTGLVLSFTTPQSPTVTSQAATPVTANTATLNGTATPNGTAATGWFRFATTDPGTCNDTFGTRTPSSGGASLGSGTGAVNFNQALAGLLPGTQYFFCALASNAVGLSVGDVLSFTTPPAAPSVAAAPATGLGATTATFNASATPNGATTTGWFRYATVSPGSCNDAFGTRAPASGGSALGTGTSPVAYSQAVTGLTPGGTYYYCPIAQNSVGTAFGGVQSFTLPAAPSVVTAAASLVTSGSAQLNGTATPNRDAATGYFRYGTTNPGTCTDAFGTRAPATGGTALGSGTTGVGFSEALTGLSPGTPYFFCAAAVNGVGTTFGAVQSFTTTNAPTPTTLAATSITASSATLNGSTNPNGATATAWFRYGTTNPTTCSATFGTATVSTSLGSGSTAVPHAQSVTGLVSGTTYYFCAVGSNAAGTTYGPVLSFTTAGAPTVTTEPATLVATTSATLNGTARPNGLTATGWFRYSTVNPGSCTTTFGTATATTALGAGTSFVPYTQALTGLAQGTTYYYCALASNSSGTRLGTVQSFTTQSAPVVTTSVVATIGATTATFAGTANPQGSAATGWFRYSTTTPTTCNDTFGTRVPAAGGTDLGSGSSAVAFTEAITGLTQGTTYYVCALASNAQGTGVGTVRSFTTNAPPATSTSAATSVLATTATLNGSADPNGEDATGYFRWGTTNPGTCSDGFGTRVPATGGTALGNGRSPVAFSQALTGLAQSTTYYYCAAATNALGADFGSVQTFTTGAGPLVTTVAPTVASTSATLRGSTNPNGLTTTAWFRYSATNPGACNDTFGTRTPTTGGTALGSGTTAVAHTASVTLVSGTTYYYCALASNSAGTAAGELLSFTTLGPPLVTTEPATLVSSSGATLNASGNPAGAAATGWFRYSATNPVTCNDAFGTRTPSTGGAALGSGSTPVAFTQALTGLLPATTYYFCAIASNAYGTRTGAVQSFTTSAGPSVATAAATGVTTTAATLNGSANPRGLAATGWFRYGTTTPGACNDTFGTRVPAAGGTALGSGSTAVAFTEGLTGLTPGTTYYYCALASNAVGTATGTVETFTTPGPPSVTTLAASALGSTGATLNGSGTANLAAATGWFRYAATDPGACDDTFGTRAPATGGASLGSGSTATSFTQALTGLAPATTYYFCAIASNANGTRFGAVLSFTTTGVPVVTTLAASNVTSSTATLNGTATPRGAATTGWFRYWTSNPGACSDSLGTRLPATGGTALGSGSAAAAFSEPLLGLTPGATYYYCAIASNAVGSAFGALQTFTAQTAVPVVVTDAATQVTGTTATLNGTANPGGSAATGHFRYATSSPGTCNDTFGTRFPATGGTALGSGTTAAPYSQALTGLSPSTTYFFCALATNGQGTGSGLVQSFTTPGAPLVTTTAASAVTGTGATLNASANPNGATATGWFRYATTSPGACNDTFGTRTPASGGTPLGAGTAALAFSQNVAGLTPGTTYYFCALASNVVGQAVGAVQSFRTPAAPVVMTSSAMVSGTSATLSGGANPNGAATTGYFRLGTTMPASCSDSFGSRAPGAGGSAVGAGQTSVPFTQTVTGLQLGATYYFCAAATNLVGTGFGEVQSFTVAAPPPTVVTTPAADVGTRDATLGASVNPNGTAAVVWFRYATTAPAACDDSFGTRVPEMGGLPAGAGSVSQAVGLSATGLRPGTEYFVCALASNTGGAAVGNVVSFKTGTEPPTVRTEPALVDDAGGAVVLRAVADTKALVGRGTFAVFTVPPLTCNPGLGRPEPAAGIVLPATDGDQPYTTTVTGLEAGVYYACASVTTEGGAATGSVVSFTMPEVAAGCGCGAGAGGLMPLLLAAWLAARRRSRR